MKNQIQACKQGKSPLPAEQFKTYNPRIDYAHSLARRKAWQPVLKKHYARVCHVVVLLKSSDVSEFIYAGIACWLHFGETILHQAKSLSGKLCPQQYACMINDEFKGMSFADLESRFDALTARIEQPVGRVLSKTIESFLDFVEVNHEAARDCLDTVINEIYKERDKYQSPVTLPFNLHEVEAIDRASKASGCCREDFMLDAIRNAAAC